MMKCGKAQCACRQDPAKRHGPYFEWTYKAKGKTINVKLTRDVMLIFRAAAQQHRKLRSLLNRLESLSRTVLCHQAKLAQSADRDERKPGIFSYPPFCHTPRRLFRPNPLMPRGLAVVLK
jgi:hypothetical protein